MALLKPESLVWADQIENLKGQTPSERRAELKKAYDLSSSQITNLLTIKACFDQTAFDKVRQADKADPPFTLSFSSAQALAGLKDKVDNLSAALHAALDVILAHRLATKKIKNLVKWIVSGKPASEFDPNKKIAGTKEDKTDKEKGEDQPGETTGLDLDKLGQLLEKAKAEKALGKETNALKKLEKYLLNLYSSSLPETSQNASGSKRSFSETIMLDWLSDIKIIQQIKSKVKKGKDISKGEVAFLWLHKLGEITGHLVKFILKLCKPFAKIIHWAWKMVIEALKELGLYKYAKAIMTLVILVAVIWFSWEAFHYGLIRPVEMLWSKIHKEQTVASEPTPIPTPQLQVSTLLSFTNTAMNHLKPKPTSMPIPLVTYQPSIAFVPTVENPKLPEMEIAAIGPKSRVNDFAVTIDEGMPVDVAVSRMQGVADPDKYTMMIGSGKQIVSFINATNTGLEIHYKSADPFGGFLDGNGKITITWEDARIIHVNEIDHFSRSGTQPDIIYQFTLIAAGEKFPLTIQCTSPDDLEHLVSTMEYFIRNSRLGHDTALAGMPYPTQGVRLSGDSVVEKLWANSPADKASLQLSDHLWSIGKATSDPQEKKDFEKVLSAQVPVTMFVASDSEWNKAKIAAGVGSNAIHPKLRKVILMAF